MLNAGSAKRATMLADADPSSADEIADLIRAGLPPHVRPYSIYGTKKVGNYVRELIRDAAVAESRFVIAHPAGDSDQILGVAELRVVSGQPFLNHIVVAPRARGQGVGRELLRGVVARVASDASVLSLDVFAENRAVLQWYERLGFRIESRSNWMVIDPDRWADVEWSSTPARCSGLPQARACIDAFGFGQFTLECETVRHTIGLLGDTAFRISSPQLLAQSSALSTLKILGPERSLLVILDEASSDLPSLPSTFLADSIRMRIQMTAIRNTLSNQNPEVTML